MTSRPPLTEDRLLFREAVESLFARSKNFMSSGTICSGIALQGWWQSEMQWARNQLHLSTDRRDLSFRFNSSTNAAMGNATTNQLDDASLRGVVAQAERNAFIRSHTKQREVMDVLPPVLPLADATVWSEKTFNDPVEQRAKLIHQLTKASKENNVVSAGYIELRCGEFAVWDPKSSNPTTIEYYTYTQAQCSMTVRHPQGKGSGWAGSSSYDWGQINADELADRALSKCLASLNPVAVEPGRYTTILEPQATAQMCDNLIASLNIRSGPERNGTGPWALEYDSALGLWRTKIGMKVIDARVTIDHDPEDRELGTLARPGLLATTFIKNGVLTQLANGERMHGVTVRNYDGSEVSRTAYRMSGGPTSVEEMIETTKRGILITRFGDVGQLDATSLLCTGFTRDGVWLIEKGKISKPVKNMRVTESPIFMLNNLEQIGPAVPVFRPVRNPTIADLSPAIVPPIKVNDFSFTALVDAV